MKKKNRFEHLIFIDDFSLILKNIVFLVHLIELIGESRLIIDHRGFQLFIGGD